MRAPATRALALAPGLLGPPWRRRSLDRSIFSLRSPTLKLAPSCIGGYSIKLGTYLAMTCAGVWLRFNR